MELPQAFLDLFSTTAQWLGCHLALATGALAMKVNDSRAETKHVECWMQGRHSHQAIKLGAHCHGMESS